MIVEYVRYELDPDTAAEFEAAYRKVGPLLGRSPHCLGWELRRSVEEPSQYVVRIEWDSQGGHEEGFRGSADFPVFFDALKVFAPGRRSMAHFSLVMAE